MKLLLGLLVVSVAFGQSFTASIRGVIQDASGSVVSGVRLTAANTDTNVSWTTLSNESGIYLLTPLPPGRYRLTAEQQGFKKFVREGIVLQVQQSPADRKKTSEIIPNGQGDNKATKSVDSAARGTMANSGTSVVGYPPFD